MRYSRARPLVDSAASPLRARLGTSAARRKAEPSWPLSTTGEPTFERAAQILRSFLELHSSAQLLSAEGAAAMAAVVEWMRCYAP